MIKKIDVDDIPRFSRRNRATQDVEEFIRSEMDSCEVIPNGAINCASLWNAYYYAVKKLNCSVRVSRRNNRVFLIKEDSAQ